MKRLLLILTIIVVSVAGDLTRETDSLALVAIKEANIKSSIDWDYTTPIDTWDGIILNAEGRVNSLTISNKGISILPSELGNLNAMTIFDCSFNGLTALPVEFQGLTSLQYFSCRNNRITMLPTEVINLPSIREFNSIHNQHHFDDIVLLNKLSVPPVHGLKTFFPQDSIGTISKGGKTDVVDLGATLTSSIREGGESTVTSYTWFEASDMVNPVSLAKECTPDKAGNFVCIAKNSLFPDDSLIQKSIMVIDERGRDSLALVAIKEANPSSTIDWDFSTSIDTWSGVTLDENGRVDRLDLHSCNLTSIPASIGTLTKLKILTLYSNQLSSLPPEIGSLAALEYMRIQHNRITLLPSEIGNLSNLVSIHCFYNQLTSLPKEFGNLHNVQDILIYNNQLISLPKEFGDLRNLRTLVINNNQLTSLPIELGKLSSLEALNFNENKLTSLPTEIGDLSNLTVLCIDNNQLTSLPIEIFNLHNLKHISCNSNQLTTLPKAIGNLSKLEHISYSDNQLTSLPIEIFNLHNLKHIACNSNQLTTLPKAIGNLSKLEYISYSDNQLTSIPVEIGSLSALAYLKLDTNNINLLPDEIGNITTLRELTIANNKLMSIPENIRKNKFYKTLAINHNYLDFENLLWAKALDGIFIFLLPQNTIGIPDTIEQGDTVTSQIHGDVNTRYQWWSMSTPNIVSTDKKFITSEATEIGEYFCIAGHPDFPGKNISQVPIYVKKVDHRERDSLALVAIKKANPSSKLADENDPFFWDEAKNIDTWSGVQLDADERVHLLIIESMVISILPSEIGNLSKLTYLNCSFNQLTSLPGEIGNLKKLSGLSCYANQLASLPSDIGTLTELTGFDCSSNELTSLPKEIGNLTELNLLFCSSNKLTSLPKEIGNLTKLTVLDCNNNELTSLPKEIGSLTELTEFDCNFNKLTSLPKEIGSLTKLDVLFCGTNQLTFFPSEIGNLIGLTELYCSFNQLTSLPREIGSLTKLTKLKCFSNELTSLPREIGNLTNLTELNCSSNKLTSLPSEIGNLTKLTELGCNFNKLTSFPSEIGNLTELRRLNCGLNELTSLPKEIGELTELRELLCSGNQLTSLPSEIGNLTKLTKWYSSANTLHFDDLLILKKMDISNTILFQQDSLGSNDTLPWGSTLTSVIRGDSNTSYEWFETADMVNPVATTKECTPTVGGNYVCIAKNTAFPTDSLFQKVIKVENNSAPVITSTAPVVATEDVTWLYEVIATDAENQPLTYAITNAPSGMGIKGNIVIWTPVEGQLTSGEVTLTVSDGTSTTIETFTITVTPVNDAPVITSPPPFPATEDIGWSYTVSATDVDNDDNILIYSISGEPRGMTITGDVISWTPIEGELTSGEVTLTVTDGELKASEKFTVSVTPVNDAPVLTKVATQIVGEDTPLTLTVEMTDGVDVDGDLLELNIGVGNNYTIKGTTITPALNYVGTLTVPVYLSDGILSSATVDMKVTVTSINDAPVLTSVKSQTTAEDTPLAMTLGMTNANDIDGDILTIVVGDGENYSVVGNVITPDTNYVGTLAVPVSVTDGTLSSAVVSMTITVTPVNDAPVLTDATTQTIPEDSLLTLSLDMVDAFDIDGDAMMLVIGSGENYTVEGSTIIPLANYEGVLTVPVSVTDGLLSSGVVIMPVTISAVNDVPVLTMAPAQNIPEDTPLTLTLSMTDASDIDGDALTLIVGAGDNYTVDGTTITPTANFVGALTVPVSVTDGALSSAVVNMTVAVTAVNDAPVLTVATAQTTAEDTPLVLTLAMTDGSDIDGDALTLIVGAGENYTVDGTTITPTANFVGALTVPVSVSDGILNSAVVNMLITVTSTNKAPELISVKPLVMMQNTPVTLTTESFVAVDVDGDALTLIITPDANAVVSGMVVTPVTDFVGTLSLTYSVSDGALSSNTIVQMVEVKAVGTNTAPVLDSIMVTELEKNKSLDFTLDIVFGSDADGDILEIVIGAGDNYDVTGQRITPATGYLGNIVVPVTLTDGLDSSETLLCSLTVYEEVFGFHKGILEKLRAVKVAVSPNPVPASVGDIEVISDKGGCDLMTIAIFDHVGNLMTESNADVESDYFRYRWNLRSQPGIGGSFVAILTYYKDGVVMKQHKQMIGVTK